MLLMNEIPKGFQMQAASGGNADGSDKRTLNLAFVLLAEPRLPAGSDVVEAFMAFNTGEQCIRLIESESGSPAASDILHFDLGADRLAYAMLLPMPVPKQEADDAARYSISAMKNGWKLPIHNAHLIVTEAQAGSPTTVEDLSSFTSLLAAVAHASGAVGVYLGNAGATHRADFFISMAREEGLLPRVMLWNGVSIAQDRDGKVSILSLGMQQLGLPNLLLVAPRATANNALGFLFDSLCYLVSRGSPLPDGDTIRRDADERLKVRHVPSPIDARKTVWRVEIPESNSQLGVEEKSHD